ncbi:MAG: hypothetical protein ACK4S4_06560 [Pyrinomonadaceae bacterium]
MTNNSQMINSQPVTAFCIESYGTRLRVESNDTSVLADARRVVEKALLGNLTEIECGLAEHCFSLQMDEEGICRIIQDGVQMSFGKPDYRFWKFFDSLARILVGEFAKEFAFIHSGVVAWKGKAILLPAHSFKGKTTLVLELARLGAEYYSDEYAVIDTRGLVHPFARPLSVRTRVGEVVETDVRPEHLDIRVGKEPVTVSTVLFTGFQHDAEWRPRPLSVGQASMRMIEYALAARRSPAMVISAVSSALAVARAYESPRGEAEAFARFFLEIVDKSSI